jgi:hypothetical protein
MNGTNGSTIDGRAIERPAPTPACASTRRTVL